MQNENQTPTQDHQGEAYQNEAQKTFMDYVFTRQVLKLRLKGIDENEYVHISMKEEIERRFFHYKTFNAKKQIKYLVDCGALEVRTSKSSSGYKMYEYKSLRLCDFLPELVKVEDKRLGDISRFMIQTLQKVSLTNGTPMNLYFRYFLQYINQYPNLFFTIDKFSGRFHTPITSFPAKDRANILIDGKRTVSIDVATMQPLILGYILKHTERLSNNEFSKWIDQGEDIYLMLARKANLQTREQSKTRFYEIMFARPSKDLALIFGNASWIGWINAYKSKKIIENPHTDQKRHSNLAWKLQKTEVEIMKRVWTMLYNAQIEFLTVHDEIIVQEENQNKAIEIMDSVLSEYFTFYKLNINKLSSN